MTPKEKAKELVDKMNFSHPKHEMYVAKQCALIAVEEIIAGILNYSVSKGFVSSEHRDNYWQQVKEEIEKL